MNEGLMSPVMEAQRIDRLENMTPYLNKMTLPVEQSSTKKGRMIFFVNTSIDGIVEILDNAHPRLMNPSGNYRTYCYDHAYLRTSFSGNGVPNAKIKISDAKKDRLKNYTRISNLADGSVKTPLLANRLMGYNAIYDLNPIIELMKEHPKLKRQPLNAKLMIYFKAIENGISHGRSWAGTQYSGENILFVNLDEYGFQTGLDDFHVLTMLTALLRKPKLIERLKADYSILFYTAKGYFVFNMQDNLDKSMRAKFAQLIRRIKPELNPDMINAEIDLDEVNRSINRSLGFAGVSPDEEDDDIPMISDETADDEAEDESDVDIPQVVDKDTAPVKTVAKKISETEGDDDGPETLDSVLADMDPSESEKFKKELADVIIDSNRGRKSTASTKRDELLREKQKDIMIRDKTIGELTKQVTIPKIESHTINQKGKTDAAVTSNSIMKEIRYANFDRTYNDTLMEKDIANAFTMFNGKTIDMNVIDVKVEDTSDSLNLKNTYTVVYEDELRRRHTIKVDIPIVFNDSFLFINGNTKLLENQITALPVIKTDNDTVRINTDYNKITIERKGGRLTPNIERLKKLVDDPANGWTVKRGNNGKANRGQLTCLEYDELGLRYNSISYGNCHFIFNVELLMEETNHQFQSDLDKILIGYKKVGNKIEPIYYDKKDPDNVDLASTIMLHAAPNLYEDFKKNSAGKKYMYTTTSIMRRILPTVVLLCFFEGLSTVVRKFNDPTVEFVDKKTPGDNYMYIQFKDGYLRYPMSNMEACIMFNGLTSFNTKNYSLADMDNRQNYIEILTEVCNDGYVAGALINFYDFMINPFAAQMLELMNLPTDLVSLIIYANNLLADNQYTTDISMQNYRIRRNEVIPSILYKELSVAYGKYRGSANNANPAKLSIDQSCVIKAIQALPTAQDYNYVGPMKEIQMRGLATMKGYAGMNADRAYKMDKRNFDDTMMGIVGVSTDNAKNCGKERHLVLEPNVINARGLLELTDPNDIKNLNMSQLSTGVELLNPGGLVHDDPVRTAMATKQRGSAIPVKDQCPVLVSTGMESTIQYRTCNDYSVVAQDDGKIVNVDEKLSIMTIEYKNGTKTCVDLGAMMAKNGGAGMYLRKKLVTKFKTGDSFKKDDILAYDPMFYKDNDFFGNRLTFGALIKTAIAGNSATYEDSMFATRSMSKRMASEITMCKSVVIGKNATVDYIVKKGQEINVGDDLIRFETAYDDAELNRLLDGIRDDLHEAIVNLGKTKIRAKYEGWIEDIICYPTIPLEEMSPSMAKIVKDCQKIDKERNAYLNKIDPGHENSPLKAGCLLTKPTGVVAPDVYGKIDGEDVTDAVLFKIFITYLDEMSDGDKCVHQTANKGTIGDMIPLGYEPRTEFRPYEEISTFQAPSAILQRGTISIEPSMLHYKGLIELKRKLYELMTGEDWNEKDRRENPYMDPENGSVKQVTESLEESMADFSLSLGDLTRLKLAFHLKLQDGNLVPDCQINKDDIIYIGTDNDAPLFFDGVLSRFKKGTYNHYNAYTDYGTNTIVATESIMPGDNIYVLR